MTVSHPLIVLAEDDPDLRLLITEELEDGGYAVTATADGQEALDAMRQRVPDLIVSDVMMPHLDGVDLYNALQDSPDLADVPFLFLTALRAENGDSRVTGCTRAVHCPKPIDFDKLLETIAGMLGVSR